MVRLKPRVLTTLVTVLELWLPNVWLAGNLRREE
jgi:hypothetical protein